MSYFYDVITIPENIKMFISSTYPKLKYFLAGIVFLLFLPNSNAQRDTITVDLFEGESYTYEYFSFLQAIITKEPSNGRLIRQGYWGNVSLRYEHEEGFVGTDYADFQYFTLSSRVVKITLEINVRQHEVYAVNDQAVTDKNIPVEIDALSNDSATRGDFYLQEVTLVNNGAVSVNDGIFTFIPNQDFSGTAYVEYVICDNEGLCEKAIITITVLDEAAGNTRVVNIKTAEDTPLSIFLPNDHFGTAFEPANGVTIKGQGNAFTYTPDPGYIGEDYMVIRGDISGYELTYIYYIEVLAKPDNNIFAKDDHVITRINESVTFNVLLNDNNEDFEITSFNSPPNGTLVNLGDGNFRFTPIPGYSGITTFTYALGDDVFPNFERASVLIIVGNYNPASETFVLTTPKNTARVLNYDVPISDFEFTVKDDPVNGQIDFYAGHNNLTIQGQEVSGSNLLVYTPDSSFVGIDEFVLEYCVGGSCIEFSILMDVIDLGDGNQFCVDDCVWPGDANDDGIVDMSDLLTVGFSMGETGDARPGGGMVWYGQFADDWGNTQKNIDKDFKFADTDGDGVISAKDTIAISEFYGLTHDLIPERYSSVKEVPIFFKVLTSDNTPGSEVRIEVLVGSKSQPAIDVYGLVFGIPYRSSTVKDGVVNMKFDANSWLSYGTPILSMTKLPYSGKLDAGYSRTSGIAATGFGRIGEIGFVVSDQITGIRGDLSRGVEFDLNNLYGVTSNGEYVKFVAPELTIPIKTNPLDLQELKYTENHLAIYPNPVQDVLTFEALGDNVMENYHITDITGRIIHVRQTVSDNPVQRLDIGHLSNGVYFLSVMTNNGLQTKKFEVLK